jgi:nitrogen fixation NifU-like protein
VTGTELQEVYRKRVLEHSRNPHNFGSQPQAEHSARGFNPLCGDKVTIYVQLKDDRIESVGFDGSGCAISMASASMMTDALTGQQLDEAKMLVASFKEMFTDETAEIDERLNEARALEGVKNYRSRIKCATLAWSTLEAALEQRDEQISTE